MDIPATEMAENTGTLSRNVSLNGSQQIPRIRQAQNAQKTQKLMIPTKFRTANGCEARRDRGFNDDEFEEKSGRRPHDNQHGCREERRHLRRMNELRRSRKLYLLNFVNPLVAIHKRYDFQPLRNPGIAALAKEKENGSTGNIAKNLIRSGQAPTHVLHLAWDVL